MVYWKINVWYGEAIFKISRLYFFWLNFWVFKNIIIFDKRILIDVVVRSSLHVFDERPTDEFGQAGIRFSQY